VPAFDLPLLDGGGTLSSDDLRGEVVVVNFWASWCQPCRAEHGELAATADAYADRGVRFVGVVYQNDADDARAFLDDLGRSYDNVIDPDSETAIDFGLFGVPETFVIDRDGTVAGNVAGPVDRALLSATLDRVLADG
jgi:cytochrome c biogenesis protein CcmG/thiol:disulfide interchange protein DsbE